MSLLFAGFSIVLLALPALWPGVDLVASGWFYAPGQGFVWADQPVLVALHWLAYDGARVLGVVFAAMAFVSLVVTKKRGQGTPPPPTPAREGRGSPCWTPGCLNAKAWWFLLLALLIAPGLVANVGFKDHWGRSRPRETVEFGGTASFTPFYVPQFDKARSNGSFVSGDGAFGFFLPAFAYVVPRRRARRVFWGAVAAGGAFSFARLAMGAHFLSDIIYAAFLMLAVVAAVHAALYGWREMAMRWRLFLGAGNGGD